MPRIPRPAPATVIAFAALFVALGGPSQAAQLARKVTHHHSHSLRGPRGPKGSFANPLRLIAQIDPVNGGGRARVQCPPRSIVTGGGVEANPGQFVKTSSPELHPDGWFGEVATSSGGFGGGTVVVLCVPIS